MVFPQRAQSISGARALSWELMRVGSIPTPPLTVYLFSAVLTHQPEKLVPPPRAVCKQPVTQFTFITPFARVVIHKLCYTVHASIAVCITLSISIHKIPTRDDRKCLQ